MQIAKQIFITQFLPPPTPTAPLSQEKKGKKEKKIDIQIKVWTKGSNFKTVSSAKRMLWFHEPNSCGIFLKGYIGFDPCN